MKERIKLIMENEHMTPSAFADKLQLGRAVMSHILNGRNNPSLDVVTRILSKMSYINPDWLITGNGNMYKTDSNEKTTPLNHTLPNNLPINKIEPDLFTQNVISTPIDQQGSQYRKEIIVEQAKKDTEYTDNKQVTHQKLPERKISKIIIYYSDNTFETFNADNRPL